MPAKAIKTSELYGNVAHNDISIFSLFSHADLMVKLVMILLFFASIYCWTLIFRKYKEIKEMQLKTEEFESIFWSGKMLDKLYGDLKNNADHPLAMIFKNAMNMLEKGNRYLKDNKVSEVIVYKANLKERINQNMSNISDKEIAKLSRKVDFLAVVGSSAPFIGLFGTVWGIMNSLQSIATSKNASLAIVAPGIAEALLATAIGLFAAIPAIIAYNFFANKINGLDNKFNSFINDLSVLISQEMDEA